MLTDFWSSTTILLATAFAAAPIVAVVGWIRPRLAAPAAIGTTAAAFAAALWVWARGGPEVDHVWASTWNVRLSFDPDGLATLYALLATGIGFAIVVYASRYLPLHLHHEGRDEREITRFYAMLLLFMGAMVGLVLAQDLFAIFVFWDITALASYFLIGFDRHKRESGVAALTALFVTGVSAILLLVGALILQIEYGTFALPAIAAAGAPGAAMTTATILIVIAGLAKSAQAPLHFWLPRAMAAPTPVSAYLHSAAMVAAGVFLISRISPLIAFSSETRALLLVVGFLSIAVGGVVALTRDVMKQLLAYSTISQYGYVVVMLGFGGTYGAAGASFYVVVHALAKSALFLTAGTVTEATGQKAVSDVGGLLRPLPWLAAGSAVAAAGLAALPLTAGFFKDELFFAAALDRGGVYPALTVAAAALTAAYMARFWFGLFTGPPCAIVTRPGPRLVAPVVVLGGLVLAGGIWPEPILRLANAAGEATLARAVDAHVAYAFAATAENVMALLAIGIGALIFLTTGGWQMPLLWFVRAFESAGPRALHDRGINGLNAMSDRVHRYEIRDLRSRVSTILLPSGLLIGLALVAEGSPQGLRAGALDRDDLLLAAMVLVGSAAAVTAMFTRDHVSLALELSGVGFCLAVAYALFAAPDVALVAVLIETLFALLFFGMLTRLPRDVDLSVVQGKSGSRLSQDPASRRRRDRVLATIAAGIAFAVTWSVLSDPAALNSVAAEQVELTPSAHGKDIVTVILADFRGLDTAGEITVVGIAFVGIGTLLHRWRRA